MKLDPQIKILAKFKHMEFNSDEELKLLTQIVNLFLLLSSILYFLL